MGLNREEILWDPELPPDGEVPMVVDGHGDAPGEEDGTEDERADPLRLTLDEGDAV